MILYCFPLVAALAGWIFNLILVRYLFGKALPSRLPALGSQVGKYIAGKALNPDLLAAKIADPKQLEAVRPFIEGHIDHFLNEKLKEKMPAIAMFIGEKTVVMMKTALMEEIDSLLPGLLQQFAGNLGSQLDIEKAVNQALNQLPEAQVATLLNEQLKREKGLFQLFGALSGFVIGLLLLVLMHLAA